MSIKILYNHKYFNYEKLYSTFGKNSAFGSTY